MAKLQLTLEPEQITQIKMDALRLGFKTVSEYMYDCYEKTSSSSTHKTVKK